MTYNNNMIIISKIIHQKFGMSYECLMCCLKELGD